MNREDSDGETTEPRFEPISSPSGVAIFDPIEKIRFELHTSDPVTLQPTSTDDFPFPMDSAVTLSTRRIVVPETIPINFWAGEQPVERCDLNTDELSVAPNEYCLKIVSVPIKLYIGLESAVLVKRDDETTIVEFDDDRSVCIGVRSLHTRPAGTITVTDHVEDVMRAV